MSSTPHPLPETFLLFMIGPDDMFLDFFWDTACLSTLTQARSQALPSLHNLLGFISVRLFAILFKWFLHSCICVLLEGKARARIGFASTVMLSQGLNEKQIELEWLLLCVSHYMPGTL